MKRGKIGEKRSNLRIIRRSVKVVLHHSSGSFTSEKNAILEKNREMFRFFKQMIEFRKSHPLLHRSHFFTGLVNQRELLDIAWHGCRLNSPGWSDPGSRVLAFTLGGFAEEGNSEDVDIHVVLNMEWED